MTSRLLAATLSGALFLGLSALVPAAADPVTHDSVTHGPVTLGDLTLSDAYIRAMPPHAPVAGGYLSIVNAGSMPDRLISASSPRAGEVQIHEMTMQGNVMKMRNLPDGLPVPAGAAVSLTPGGYHLMFLKVPEPIATGQVVEVTLIFKRAGSVTLPFAVRDRAAVPTGAAPVSDHAGH